MSSMRLRDKATWYVVAVAELGLLWVAPVADVVRQATGFDPLEAAVAGWDRFVRSLPQRR